MTALFAGTDLPPHTRGSRVMFSGMSKWGETALVIRTDVYDYAQYDDIRHPKAFGWWAHPLGTFRPRL